jgi:hypothetical protein
MKASKWILACLLLCLAAGWLVTACGDDDDDDDDTGAGDDDDSSDDDDNDDNGGDDDSTDDDDDDTIDDDDDDTTGISGKLAFIYEADDANGLTYKLHLDSLGYSVTLYAITDLDSKIDFSNVDAFLIDVIDSASDWDTTRRNAVFSTNKPVVALGDGAYIFDGSGKYIDPDICTWRAGGSSVTPADTGDTIWSEPNDLSVTTDPVFVLTTTDWVYSLEDTGSAPVGVEFLGGNPAETDEYLIVVEDGKYAMWGFGAVPPSNYTLTGKSLFINLIEYLRSAK